jgi:hypothetical protein
LLRKYISLSLSLSLSFWVWCDLNQYTLSHPTRTAGPKPLAELLGDCGAGEKLICFSLDGNAPLEDEGTLPEPSCGTMGGTAPKRSDLLVVRLVSLFIIWTGVPVEFRHGQRSRHSHSPGAVPSS